MYDDIPKSAKTCQETKRRFEPGESFYSVLVDEDGTLKRYDYCVGVWKKLKRPDGMIGWWKSRISPLNEKKIKLAPNDILMNLFDELADRPDKAEVLYVLTLLLIRRRIFRYEQLEGTGEPAESLTVYAIRRETTYTIPVVPMDETKTDEVQEYLASLLYSIG